MNEEKHTKWRPVEISGKPFAPLILGPVALQYIQWWEYVLIIIAVAVYSLEFEKKAI